jgi:preprotein translocase subunit YajC
VLISNAWAQTAPAAAGGGSSPESMLFSLLPLVLMFVVLYFLMIRPQMKRQKEHKSMIDALAKGDEIVTAGGLLGKVSKLGDSYLHIEIGSNQEVQVERSAVVRVLPKGTMK